MKGDVELMPQKEAGSYYLVEFFEHDETYNFYDVLAIRQNDTHVVLLASDRVDFLPNNLHFKVTDQV